MPTYEIKRWDSVIYGNGTYPMPMVYFKPDEEFYKYAKENEYMIIVTIQGSNSHYDGKPLVGVIDSSATFPNDRPNFFNETGYLVITLFCNWNGYPPNLGVMNIRGREGQDAIKASPPAPFVPPQPLPWPPYENFLASPPPESSNNSKNFNYVLLIAILIPVILGLMYVLYKK